MIPNHLAEALEQAAQVGQLFVATADAHGVPHLAIAEGITLEGEDTVGVTGWFCPRTAENTDANAGISLVVWDARQDAGFQLIGEVTQMLDIAMLDGYMPGETEAAAQVERKLVVRVHHILTFSHAHHSDIDLG